MVSKFDAGRCSFRAEIQANIYGSQADNLQKTFSNKITFILLNAYIYNPGHNILALFNNLSYI